jgi:hypothetical protein
MKENYLRVPITMPAEMVEALEAMSLKAKVTGGKKLANTELVRAAVSVLLKSGIDISGCKSEEEVEDRLTSFVKA